ncbi:MAG: gephyrin-like molybdotransferase Glp [Anaerolineales bacterium]
MLSVQEARQRILSYFSPLESELVPLEQAAGRALAAQICTTFDLPLFDNSSMDGFAVRAADLADASRAHPLALPVIGDIPAGTAPSLRVEAGQTARIMTGAPLPAGADAVVMVEDTDFNDHSAGALAPQTVSVYRAVETGENVRKQGADLKSEQEILSAGRLLRAQDVGMLAMLGVASVQVHRRPRVAILSTGDEILPVELPLTPGKIHDTNSDTLTALAAQAGCEVIRLGVAADTGEAVREKLDAALAAPLTGAGKADVILSSAGVSVGAFDYVKEVVESGGALEFWKVNMRPGKPLAFGHYRGVPFFGLPGNPVSAFVGFLVFVEPAIRQLQGQGTVERPRVRTILGESLESDGRESYLRATVTLEDGRYVARFSSNQSSGNLFSLVEANALVIIPAGVTSCPAGAEVDAWLL